MPEYLTPGVYVEEVSFRSKSIEGVSTSTTAFVGPALRGPVVTDAEDPNQAPELLTSFGDFERIYGGIDPLDLGGTAWPNYLALAVQAYFNNGGARLYVSRVDLGGAAASAPLLDGVTPRGFLRSRFPGAQGNATRVEVRLKATPAGTTALQRAPTGSTARVGTPTAPLPIVATNPLAPLQEGDTLTVTATLDGAPFARSATFRTRRAASVVGTLGAAGDRSLRVSVDGGADVEISVAAPGDLADLLVAANAALGATATATDDGGALRITASSTGASSRVVVFDAVGLTFADATSAGSGNVVNLAAVTPAEVEAAFAGQEVFAVTVSAGRVRVEALDASYVGAAASLAVSGTAPALGRLGFPAPVSQSGSGAAHVWYVKASDGTWDRLGGGADLDVLTASAAQTSLLTLTVDVRNGLVSQSFDDLGLDATHPRAIMNVLSADPAARRDWLAQQIWLDLDADTDGDQDPITALQLVNALLGSATEAVWTLAGGTDGSEPANATTYREALRTLNRREDISIVAAPGAAAWGTPASRTAALDVQSALIEHVEPTARRNYRVAVLDTPPGQIVSDAIAWRAEMDSQFAALYYPWVMVANPLARTGDLSTPREIALPPSGFLCGIYARTDVLRGVHKAPANEVVRGALRFERPISFDEQAVLNPIGVNCLRTFPGRGHRVWGARTVSSDPEWKYVNVRRYFNYLEASIERGTQWAVFEPNGERLWANITETIDGFLFNEWKNGALLGASPKEAYFVRCDRSTMSQNDIDNGRLICLIGVAPLRPAEFVIFRIGQKTADARD